MDSLARGASGSKAPRVTWALEGPPAHRVFGDGEAHLVLRVLPGTLASLVLLVHRDPQDRPVHILPAITES